MTAPPTIDPSDPQALVNELFGDDRWAKDQFAQHVSNQVLELSNALAVCFRLVAPLNDVANRTEEIRAAYVSGFTFGVLDDIVVSAKLLLTGKISAAGNLMRQAGEGIALAILCSSVRPLIVQKQKRKEVKGLFWELLKNDDKCTRGHRAIEVLEWNAAALGVNANAIERLKEAKEHYNQFSHCGKVTIACRMALDQVGKGFIGGEFDEAKLDGYRAELASRIALCKVLPDFMRRMTAILTPPAAEVRS
jgi:hypothetical protein